MRIGINCLKIDPSFAGGLNTYTLGLLDGFAATANGHRFHLYVSHSNRHFFAKYAGRKAFELIVAENQMQAVRVLLCRATLLTRSPKLYELASNAVFSDLRAMMDADCDVIYTPTVVLPCFNSRRPTVLSMHDIQHVHYPEFFSWPRRLSRRVTYGLSAQHARFFQASSEFIKQDLLHHFKSISAEQITVIPEGVNVKEFSTPVDTVSLFKRYGLPARFIFYPGQLWPHKNHITVLRSLKQIEAKNGLRIPLVLTGGKYGAASGIFRYIAGQSMDYVHYLGRVPFADLVGLYQRAALLVVPSLHESNSLPILEAAAAGTPIIASQIPPNEELAGVLQLNLFEPLKIAELADLIVWLWKDEKTASAQAAHNRLHVGAYSWQSAADKYFGLFERATAA
jgi:glycosyltransferase involved in cell wall biosynthesis